ncbi:MAG: hypothetical protein R3B06_14350 [Kofleriaceae bacterium]
MDRFCGRAVFPVEGVEVYVSEPDEGEPGGVLLNLELRCGPATSEEAPEDERIGWTRPGVEVWIPVPAVTADALAELTVHVPWPYLDARDARHRLYVFEHEDLWDLEVRFGGVVAGMCQVVIVATAQDPNHYDGSKPPSTVTVAAWFALPGAGQAEPVPQPG